MRKKFNLNIKKIMYWLSNLLTPIGICVVLPVMVVWLVMRVKQNETNRKTEIMLKAIESGASIDVDFFKAQQMEAKTIKERLLKRLTGACILSLLGVIMLVLGIYFASETVAVIVYNRVSPLILMVGGVLLAVGLALFAVFFVGKKMLAKEIEAEEKALEQK